MTFCSFCKHCVQSYRKVYVNSFYFYNEPCYFCDKQQIIIHHIPDPPSYVCPDYEPTYICREYEPTRKRVKQEQSVSTKSSSDIVNSDCCYTCVFGLNLSEEDKRMCIANNRSEVEPYNVCYKYQRSSKYKKEKN